MALHEAEEVKAAFARVQAEEDKAAADKAEALDATRGKVNELELLVRELKAKGTVMEQDKAALALTARLQTATRRLLVLE